MVKTKLVIIVIVLFLLGGTFAASYKKMRTSQVPVITNPITVTTPTTLPYGSNQIKVGQPAMFLRNSVTVTKVTDDSRCPEGVQCVWAGTAKIELQSVTELGTKTNILELGKELSLGSEKVTFARIAPTPKAGSTITEGDYVITLTVVPDTVTAATTPSNGGCYVGGCSSEICSDKQDIASNCIYRPEFACYKKAVCERQATGVCGWTNTPALQACIRDQGAVDR